MLNHLLRRPREASKCPNFYLLGRLLQKIRFQPVYEEFCKAAKEDLHFRSVAPQALMSPSSPLASCRPSKQHTYIHAPILSLLLEFSATDFSKPWGWGTEMKICLQIKESNVNPSPVSIFSGFDSLLHGQGGGWTWPAARCTERTREARVTHVNPHVHARSQHGQSFCRVGALACLSVPLPHPFLRQR